MAVDVREPNDDGASAGQTKPLPKGVILDKDGKPCRSCNSKSAFSAWASQAKQQTKDSKTSSTPLAISSTTAAMSNAFTTTNPRVQCPPDVEALGRSSWTLLHSIAATYPEKPSRSQQTDVISFVQLFSRLYPCWVCAEDFQGYIAKDAPKAGTRDELAKWLCGAHNEVNRKLGKPEFDCGKWDERWRTGPKDGSCD